MIKKVIRLFDQFISENYSIQNVVERKKLSIFQFFNLIWKRILNSNAFLFGLIKKTYFTNVKGMIEPVFILFMFKKQQYLHELGIFQIDELYDLNSAFQVSGIKKNNKKEEIIRELFRVNEGWIIEEFILFLKQWNSDHSKLNISEETLDSFDLNDFLPNPCEKMISTLTHRLGLTNKWAFALIHGFIGDFTEQIVNDPTFKLEENKLREFHQFTDYMRKRIKQEKLVGNGEFNACLKKIKLGSISSYTKQFVQENFDDVIEDLFSMFESINYYEIKNNAYIKGLKKYLIKAKVSQKQLTQLFSSHYNIPTGFLLHIFIKKTNSDLRNEIIQDLQKIGFEQLPSLKNRNELLFYLINSKAEFQLNDGTFLERKVKDIPTLKKTTSEYHILLIAINGDNIFEISSTTKEFKKKNEELWEKIIFNSMNQHKMSLLRIIDNFDCLIGDYSEEIQHQIKKSIKLALNKADNDLIKVSDLKRLNPAQLNAIIPQNNGESMEELNKFIDIMVQIDKEYHVLSNDVLVRNIENINEFGQCLFPRLISIMNEIEDNKSLKKDYRRGDIDEETFQDHLIQKLNDAEYLATKEDKSGSDRRRDITIKKHEIPTFTIPVEVKLYPPIGKDAIEEIIDYRNLTNRNALIIMFDIRKEQDIVDSVEYFNNVVLKRRGYVDDSYIVSFQYGDLFYATSQHQVNNGQSNFLVIHHLCYKLSKFERSDNLKPPKLTKKGIKSIILAKKQIWNDQILQTLRNTDIDNLTQNLLAAIERYRQIDKPNQDYNQIVKEYLGDISDVIEVSTLEEILRIVKNTFKINSIKKTPSNTH